MLYSRVTQIYTYIHPFLYSFPFSWSQDTAYSSLRYRLPKWLSGEESACQHRRHKRVRFCPWTEKIPRSREWQPTPVFLAGKFHGQTNLAGYIAWSHKESEATEHIPPPHTHTLCYMVGLYRVFILYVLLSNISIFMGLYFGVMHNEIQSTR